jgi:NAD+ synthase
MSSRLGPSTLSLENPSETVERIVRFLKTHTERIGAKHLVVAMSGGLDSSVTAALCSKAIGGKRTLGFCLPEAETRNEKSIRDAQETAKRFAVKFKLLDISNTLAEASNLVNASGSKNPIPLGNMKARIRAMILYYYANATNGLVVGTGDKSELMLGYFTKFGDGASDIQPIGDLFKTTVRDLAKHLEIPAKIYSKPSSPELWPGQTAEKDLGLAYDKLDLILWGLERWMTPEEISGDLKIPITTVKRVRDRWISSEHKRRVPLAMKLGFRTSGQDMRVPNNL